MEKLFSIDFQLDKVTGVEKVMLDIHQAVKNDYEAKIVGNIPFSTIREEHHINPEEYVQLQNWFMFHDSIVIVHERRLLVFFWVLNHFFFQRIRIVYVHHNVFNNHRFTTLLPQTIVAIADRGVENLVNYFRVPRYSIHKIHNCVVDKRTASHHVYNRQEITILLLGRINAQKQQITIVNQLAGKIDPRIKVLFAGDGPQLEELRITCKDKESFSVLGFRSDVTDLMMSSDFVLLFSVHEGLPITLIEATMMGIPIICNDVGGNSEICLNGENGWVLNSWEQLIETLNGLPALTDEQYLSMCHRSREIYEDKFTFAVFKQKYLNLLSHL